MVRILVTAALLAAAAVARAVVDAPMSGQIVPGSYIVEFEDDQDPHDFVKALDEEATVRQELRYKLFKGASIHFKDIKKSERAAVKVASHNRVKNVWPVRSYPRPQVTIHSTGNGQASSLSKRQWANDTFSPHVMTQVTKLREAGITGKGIRIGVVDTGTDYTHPALGGCFGKPECLVSYGTDLVGDAYTGSGTKPVPDPDPLDQCAGHGTHVAGIIAAQSAKNPYGIIGAAEGVKLGSYRVFGCTGQVDNDVLIAAFNKAYEDGSDLISCSIGGNSGWSDDPWSLVASRIVENGVPCIIAAGNAGAAGVFLSSTAAQGRGVTAIGSIDNILTPSLLTQGSFKQDGKDGGPYGFVATDFPGNWSTVTLPLWALSFNTSDTANGCDPFPDSTPDLSGKIVLIRRGTCPFTQKANNAHAKGANYVIFYNNELGVLQATTTGASIKGAAVITSDQGANWIKALQAGSDIEVTLPDPDNALMKLTSVNNTATGGFSSAYTSWGPTDQVEAKPQFSTPGGNILSTWPTTMGSYAVLSGTSMATPLAAGIYALLMVARNTKDPKTLENYLAATARPVQWKPSTTAPAQNFLAPVPQQGGGLIQAWDAAHATTLLSVSGLSFNDTENFIPQQSFSIANTGTKEITYTISHVGAGAAYTFDSSYPINLDPDTFPPDVVPTYATFKFSPSGNFTVAAGNRKIITVNATAPTGLVNKRLPIYSGFISISGSDGSISYLPYMGVAGSLRGATVLGSGMVFMQRSPDGDAKPLPANASFTLPPPGHANDTTYIKGNRSAVAILTFHLSMGSNLIYGDLVPLNGTSVKTLGQLDQFPQVQNGRNNPSDGQFTTYNFDGKLADGTYAPAGTYKIVLKALRIFGNPNNATDYDVEETPSFQISYLPLDGKRAVLDWRH